MMKTHSRKVLSLILSLIMLFSLCVPMACAAEENTSDIPCITVNGQGADLIGNNGEVYKHKFDFSAILTKELIEGIASDLIRGNIIGDWQPFADRLYDALSPLYENVLCDGNGDPQNGSRLVWTWSKDKLSTQKDNYVFNSYTMEIDWRIDPRETADEINRYIEAVCEVTGHSRVKLIGRCMGATCVLAYLEKYGFDRIDDLGFYIPAIDGIDLVGACFAGKLSMDADSVDRFANYVLNDGTLVADDMLAQLLSCLVSLFNQLKILGFGTSEITRGYNIVAEIVMPRLIRGVYASFPAYWAMINDDYFSDAITFTFNTPELKEEYAGVIRKATEYHNDIFLKAYDILRDFADGDDAKDPSDDKRVYVISKYNVPLIPVYEGCERTGDFFSETADTSFGGTGGICFKALGDEHIKKLVGTENEKYLSPDKMIDASTGLFPDTTWYVKDCNHSVFSKNFREFFNWILADNSRNVFTDTKDHPQYLIYDKETNCIYPYTYKETSLDDNWSDNPLVVLLNFLKAFFTYIVNYIKTNLPAQA